MRIVVLFVTGNCDRVTTELKLEFGEVALAFDLSAHAHRGSPEGSGYTLTRVAELAPLTAAQLPLLTGHAMVVDTEARATMKAGDPYVFTATNHGGSHAVGVFWSGGYTIALQVGGCSTIGLAHHMPDGLGNVVRSSVSHMDW